MNGEWVESLSKNETGIGVTSMSKSGKKITREFDKVFVALGPIQTAALMIRSKLTNRDFVSIRDSQMIVLPVVLRGLRKTGSGALTRVSLSDAIAYSKNQGERPGSDWFAQLYGASADLNDAILAKVSPLRMVPKFFRDWTFARLGFAMVFLPGSGSGSIEVKEINGGKIRVFAKSNERLGWRLKKVRFGLRGLGYYPLPLIRKTIPVGLGYHFGASFPISKDPNERGDDVSDELGTINGIDGIHLVDASVLPAISSRPITLTTMANAFRIARTAVLRNGGHYK
jgi:choline dehydrogenase-like flavoprotein